VNQQERTQLFADFVNERERIRVKKEDGEPRPWTDDNILDVYRFCNVRREDDRVTRWIKHNWRDPFFDHPNLTLAMALARFVNWPPTLEEVGFPHEWQPVRVEKLLKARRARGEQVWNAAYMISTCGQRMDKAEHVVGVLNRVAMGPARPLGGDTLEGAWSRLRKINGLGSFLAAQIVADLKQDR
jgi:5-hmdU DNA kinase-like protein